LRTLNLAMLLVVVHGTSATRARRRRERGPLCRPVRRTESVRHGDADVDVLSGDDPGASAGHAPLDPDRLGRRDRWWPGRAGVPETSDLGRVSGSGGLRSRTPSAARCSTPDDSPGPTRL
jgi:hypothetical protein